MSGPAGEIMTLIGGCVFGFVASRRFSFGETLALAVGVILMIHGVYLTLH